MLYHLCYASTQTRPFTAQHLAELLANARDSNARHRITGLLLHREDSFLQVLEGDEADVRMIYDRIREDPRHRNLNVLFAEPIDAREFADWRMAFLELDGVDVAELPGFSDYLVNEDEPRRFFEELTRARQVMLLFRTMQ
jgi:hypothetical protein